MRTTLTALGGRLMLGAALGLTTTGAARAGDLIAVDRQGRPVPGVTLALELDPVGTFAPVPRTAFVTTDDEGVAELPDAQPTAVDIVSHTPEWAIAFVHAPRITDDTAAPDLLQRQPRVLDLRGTVACVLEPTGTLELRVVGAGPDQRFHVCFLDERPEPESHRPVRSAHSFSGATARLPVPAGRGSLYVAREGTLGTNALDDRGQLLIAVTPGGTTRIDLLVEEGPEALLLAPFGTIPFPKLHALAPDGRTVVAEWAFDSSPLRLPSSRVRLAGYEGAPAPLRKHLLRAVDVPLQRPLAPPKQDDTAPARRLQPAPLELIFAMDVGGKLRLPESESGWILAAQTGARILEGPVGLSIPSGVERPSLGVLRAGAQADDTWTADVTLVDGNGQAAPYREVLVAGVGHLALRALSGADGRLRIDGIRGPEVDVALLSDATRVVTVSRAEGSDASQARLVAAHDLREIVGTWAPAGTPTAGPALTFVPIESGKARRFGTRAMAVAVPDSDGRFRVAAAAAGSYRIVSMDGSQGTLRVEAGSTPMVIAVAKDGEVLDVTIER